jgi:putative nucleotidyltransferase with HDIG domain
VVQELLGYNSLINVIGLYYILGRTLMKNLPNKLKMYLAALYVVTIIVLIFLHLTDYMPVTLTNYRNIIFFGMLAIITESFTVPFKGFSFSTSLAIQLATFILYGPLSAVVVTIIGVTLRIVKVENGYINILNTPIYKILFNYCVMTLSILSGSFFYFVFGGKILTGNISASNILAGDIPIYIPQLVVFCAIYSIINCLIISILFSILSNKNLFYSFINNAKLSIFNTFILAPFGVILSLIFYSYKYFGVILFLFPILLARYTFLLYFESKAKFVQTVDALMSAMEARDNYTEGHSKRVAQISESIARELKYNDWKIEQLNIAALLHDVGKIGIDDYILNKPGKLTDEEFDIIKTHPEIGYNILRNIKDSEYISDIVRYHHERYDGKGYPAGKAHQELVLDVFIIQLADSIDAMATDRPYRKALTQEEILKEIEKNSGTQFHPTVVDAYFKYIKNK